MNASAIFSALPQRRGLCKWFITGLRRVEGTKEGRHGAFVRLAQSKILQSETPLQRTGAVGEGEARRAAGSR